MAHQLKLQNVASCMTATIKATETTKESSKYYLKTYNKDGSITNHSVFGNNTKSADDKTFDWVFRHKHPDGETKRVFTIKDLKVDEVIGFDKGTFNVKLSENQDFTVEYLSNALNNGAFNVKLSENQDFTVKYLSDALNNGAFTAKLSENQDFTVEYLSNATDTGDQDIGYLDFSISSI